MPPAATVLVPLVLLMLMLAAPLTASASVALLLARLLSVKVAGNCKITVLVTVPLSAETEAVTVKNTVVLTGSDGITRPVPSIPANVVDGGQVAPRPTARQLMAVLFSPVTAGSLTVVPSAGPGPLLPTVMT